MQHTFNLWEFGVDSFDESKFNVAFVGREISPEDMESENQTNLCHLSFFGLLDVLMKACNKARAYKKTPTIILETDWGIIDVILQEFIEDENIVFDSEPLQRLFTDDEYSVSEVDGEIVVEFDYDKPLQRFIKNHSTFKDGGYYVVLDI